jgi:pilus assembly protein CpaE
MTKPAVSYDTQEEGPDARALAPLDAQASEPSGESVARARPIPRVSIDAFCEDAATADVVQIAGEDRRLSKVHLNVHMGGVAAAMSHYEQNPTPNLIIIESTLPRSQMLAELDRLAESCDAGTKVLVVGGANDVILYRELLKRGVSEYLIAPISPIDLMESISNLYNDPHSDPIGHVLAFIGAKGGVGSSTICHNVAWTMSEALKANVVIADLDLAFGTTGLDFNQDPVQGIADALSSPERLDEMLLDRLLTKCSEHLSIFAAPVVLDRDFELSADACGSVIDVVRRNVPYVAVDLPHTWTSWCKRVLLDADEVVITAVPDLANLRNAKNVIDLLKQSRANDGAPLLVINMVGVPKRQEISVKEFCQNLELQPAAVIEFDSESFSNAATNGQMVEELNKKAKSIVQFREIAMALAHRKDAKVEPKKSPFAPLLEKLKLKR